MVVVPFGRLRLQRSGDADLAVLSKKVELLIGVQAFFDRIGGRGRCPLEQMTSVACVL